VKGGKIGPPTAENAPCRVWAAIEPLPGVVVADVRDVPRAVVETGTAAYRPFLYSVVDGMGRATCRDGGRADCGCRPGKPCPHANATAARWWDTWQERTDQRIWRARKVKIPGRWATSDWSDEDRATRAEAVADARRVGFPRVVLLDGHGSELEVWVIDASTEPTLAGDGTWLLVEPTTDAPAATDAPAGGAP